MSSAYCEAATVMDAVLSRKVGLRSAALASNVNDKRKVMALVTRTLEYKLDIEKAINSIKGAKEKLCKIIPGRSMRLLMIYDLILGNGKISGGGKAARACKELETSLKVKLASVIETKKETDSNLSTEPVRRWVRVNTIKTNIDKAESELKQFISSPKDNNNNGSGDYGEGGGGGGKKRKHDEEDNAANNTVVSRDPHIANLLLCHTPPGLPFYSHPRVKDGSWILQDKASCFSAEALAGPDANFQGGDVIDACAAPGNKTTHAASLVSLWSEKQANQQATRPTVFAFDRDEARLNTLKARAKIAGCSSAENPLVVAECADFLTLDTHSAHLSNVTSVLVDPSCSGSGIIGIDRALDNASNKAKDVEKVEKLAKFQESVILKAMSFPRVNKVVYSTCSIYDEENELVVAAVLNKMKEKQVNGESHVFKLSSCLPLWQRRGRQVGGLSEQEAACLVRADPELDSAHGFFVACFETGENNATASKLKKNRKKKEKRRLKRIRLRGGSAATPGKDNQGGACEEEGIESEEEE